jgi:hypothetical protein
MAVSEDKYNSRVDFIYPKLWLMMNWGGLITMFLLTLFGGFMWYTVVGHLGNGLESAIKDSAHDIQAEEWFVKALLLGSPLVAISIWSGFTRLRQPSGFLEARAEGLSVACYTFGPVHLTGFGDWFTWGMTKWDNLSEVGVVKRFFIRGIGLQFENLDDFLKSRRVLKRALLNLVWVRRRGVGIDAGEVELAGNEE